MTELYTTSRVRTARSCLRLHHYKYVLALRSPETDAMRFGTIGHACLEAYYRVWQRGNLSDRLPAAIAELDQSFVSDWDRIKLHVLLVAYDARWGGMDWDVLAVEQEFQFMLGDRRIGGKIDAIIRDRIDGRAYVVEHKTTGTDASIGGAYWERLTLDTQVSVYIDGAGVLGYDIAGCIYDVLKRPGHEQKQATPPDAREYTKGKGCKACGGSAKPGAIAQGRGSYSVVFASEVKVNPCADCNGTGWKEPPRLRKDQRETNETEDAFRERIVEHIAENPDATLMRGVVVRLDDELPAMRQDLLDVIALIETGLTPRNPDACVRAGQMCPFFEPCVGRSDINSFPRGPLHPELSAT